MNEKEFGEESVKFYSERLKKLNLILEDKTLSKHKRVEYQNEKEYCIKRKNWYKFTNLEKSVPRSLMDN
jgi:hypothetical protein